MVARRKSNGNGHAAHDLEVRLDALMNDLTALQKDVRGLARGAGDYAVEQANGAMHSAQEKFEQARDDVEDWANGNVDSLRDTVREQPLVSCILSMSAGALLGALLLRR